MTDSQYLALIEVDYVDKVNTCLQCTLFGTESCLDTKCLSSQRDDGRDVIFVVKETDSQYLVSEDQNTIECNGEIMVAVGHGNEVHCQGCVFFKRKEGCNPVPCSPTERFDGNFVIFVTKEIKKC